MSKNGDGAMRILISSASAKVPLVNAAKKAVARIGSGGIVVAGDADARAITAYVADDFWHMPPTRDESYEHILAGLKDRHIDCVLPTRDGELAFWARHRERLAGAGVSVITSDASSIERCVDKLAFFHFGARHGLPFIQTSEGLEDVGADRVVVKERYGAGSRSLGLNLSKEDAVVHAKTLVNPIFQPMVEGVEISIDAWLSREGKLKGLVLRRRELVVGGESRISATFSNPAIEAIASRVLASLNLSGPVVMQAFINEDNDLKVIECNPRFGGASTLGIAVGLESLYWSFLEASGEKLDHRPFLRSSEQLRQIRISTDVYVAHTDI